MICKRFLGINFEKGWSDVIFDSLSTEQRNIQVLNDQISVMSLSKLVADILTKGWHHSNLFVIYLVQNVYNHRKSQQTNINLTLECGVFCNCRDASQFCTMA